MKFYEEDERVYLVCDTCCWGVSGVGTVIDAKAGTHETENPGHRVKEATDD